MTCLDSKDAAAAIAPVVVALTRAIKETYDKDPVFGPQRVLALMPLVHHLDPKDAAEAVAVLNTVIEAKKDWKQVDFLLVVALSALADRLDSKAAAAATAPAAAALTRAMRETKDKDQSALLMTASALVGLVPHLGPKDAAPIAAALSDAMRNAKDPDLMPFLALALSEAVASLDPKAASQVAVVFTKAMKDSKNAFLLRQFAQSLSKVVVRLDPKDATTAIASALIVLTQAIKENQNPNDLVQYGLWACPR